MWGVNRAVAGMLALLVVAPATGLVLAVRDIYDMWQFKSHATRAVLRSIDDTREITREGTGKYSTTYTYTEGDYVFETEKGDEVTVKSQYVPNEIMQNYLSGKAIILYYDNSSPQNFRLDGQTASIRSVILGLIAYLGFLYVLSKARWPGRRAR